MPDFDTVLHPDFLVPMIPRRQILTGHSVAVRAVGCRSALAQAGQPSHEITWDAVRESGADIIMAACCGQSEHTAHAAGQTVPDDLHVHILDGAKHFSRPSPTIMESMRYFADTIEALRA